MAALYKVTDRAALKGLADALGSDTGYMLGGGFARVAGRGERVFPIPAKGRYHLLLLLPKSGVDTAACYKKYDEAPDRKAKRRRNVRERAGERRIFQMLCRRRVQRSGRARRKTQRRRADGA